MHYSKTHFAKDGRSVLVRTALSHDAAAITAISNQCYRDSPFLSKGPEDPEDSVAGTLAYIEDLLDAEREAFLVAVTGDQIVGFAHLDGCGTKKKTKHRCEFALSIQQGFRGQGIGRCLVDSLISLAADAGYEQIELNVIEANTPGVSLYQSCGFQTSGRLPHAFKYPNGDYGDYLIMVKNL
ncbi:MAG: GNAT family N-acetyltransferase [Oscillospiraceae bacterium]|nr:GNAT family N-acetyltransferase [Oscillospiraceae bacterium]